MTDQIDLSDLPLVETESALGGALSTEAPQGVPGLLDGLPRAVPEELRQQYRGLKEPPDQAAKVLKLSERTGIPDETVRNRIAEVERLANEPDWDEFEVNAPRSAELMVKDLELFKLAHDVPEELSRFEQLVSQFKGGFYQAQAGDELSATARAASAGLLGAQQPLGPVDLDEVAGPPRIPDSGPTRFIKGANDRMSRIMRGTGQNVDVMRARIGGFPGPEMGGDPETRAAAGRAIAETKIAEAIRNLTSARQQYQSPEVKALVEAEGFGPALSVFAENPITTTLDLIATSGYPMLAAIGGAVAGGPAGGTGRAAGMYLSSYDLNYNARVAEALSDEGINPADQAAVAAALRDPALVRRITQRAFQYATPIAAFDSLSAIAAGAKLASTPVREAAAQTTVQGVFGGAGEALGQVSDTGDIQSWGEVIAEGIAEIPGGVIEPGAYHLIDHLRGEQRVVDAEAFKNRVTELTELANQSKLRERSPQKFEQVIDGLLGENADADVYINAHEFSEFFQSQGLNPMEIAGQLTGVAAQLPEAMVRNGDIRIKASEYITRLGHTEYQQGLNEIVRAQPEAMSAKEAAEWQSTQQERFKQLVEQIDAEHEADTAWNESAKQVEDFVRDQIMSTGRFAPEVAAKDAALHGAMAKVLASKMNIQPHQVYERFGLRVAGAPVVQQDGMQYDQQTGALVTDTPEFRNWFGDSKVVDESGKPLVVYHGTTRDFTSFEKGEFGFHFASIPTMANRAAANMQEQRDPSGAQNVMPVYLNIKNPIRLPDVFWWDQPDNWIEHTRKYPALNELVRGIAERHVANPEQFSAELKNALEAEGVDGIVYSNFYEGRGEDAYIAFRPEQIKSAISNRGTFDPNDPNILNQAMSTRVPTAMKATEDPLLDLLVIDYDGVLADTKTLEKNAEILRQLPNMRPTKSSQKSAEKAVEQFIEHVKNNLLFLHDLMPAEQRVRAKLWYDGARKMAEAWAERYGISEMQAAGAIAVLSPQNDWFQNVSAAERVADIVFGMRDFRWDDAMSATAQQILGKKADPKMAEAAGKTLGEVLDRPDIAARWIRVFDQTHNDRGYNVLTPEGGVAGARTVKSGEPATMAWKTYKTIANAVSILTDGRAENVFYQIGAEHKVRNFYNNIYAPNSELGFTTIDTHAVAAALLRPLAGGDLEVLQNFGSGAASSSISGLSGTYPIYLEAYRRAAEERGLLPREMQSITWEAVRGLFEGAKKSRMKADANAIWGRYKAGKITQARAQNEVAHLADHITPPMWVDVPYTDRPGRTYRGAAQAAVDAAGPRGVASAEAPRILFEVAPDPNNAELTERWNALTPAQRFATSRRVAEALLPKVLAEFAVQGDLTVQVGGYQGATNPSLALTLPNGALAGQVARVLGHVLNQDSMVALAGEAFEGGAPVGAVTVALPEGFGEEQIRDLYDRLWQLHDTDGNPLVGGFAAANDQMLILNFSGIDDAQFATMVDGFLGGEYDVKLDTVYAAFIDREEYGYGSGRSSGQASARKSSRTRRVDSLRAEAADLLEQSLAGSGGTFFQGLAPAEGAGPAQRGTGRVSTPTVREDGRVELTHWSRVSGLQALDPSKYGTGIAGAEKRRKMNNPGAWVDRTYYGLSVGQDGGYRREASLGRQRYTASIEPERLYDLANDPDGLFTGDLTEYEKAVRDAGYAGYWVNNPSLGLTAAVFEALPVEAHVDESPARYGQDPIDLPLTIPDDDPMLRETVDLPGREALREQIVGSILANGRPVEGRKPVVWVMGGGGGAGKGTILNRLQEIGELRPDGVVHIDPDGIKAMIPEYQQILALGDSRAAAVVHEESSLLRKQAEAGAIAMRTDMVLDVTLGNPAKGLAALRQFKDAGYEIRLVGVTTPTQTAVERAVARGKNSGRYVVLDELVKAHRGFSAGFEQYAALADDVRLFDNSGRLPALIYTKDDIVNPDLYNMFLEKANETDQAAQPQPAPADRAGPVPQRGGGPQAPGEVPGAGAVQQAADPGAVPGQRLSQQARGSIQFPADLTQAPGVINLLDGADLSTFLHETGHFFFEVYRTVASQPNAPESVVADMQALLEFVGAPDLATWNAMTIEQRRDGHERVARAFEAYLFEGKAPSPALTDLFRTFSRWLVNVYKSLRGLNVELTPEVRGVFDRMLATEEEIKAVETLRQYAPLFESMEQAGMSLQDWAEYQTLGQAATDAADSELQHRSLKDMRWLSNAKARELKRLQREADAKRRDVRKDAEAAIYATPVYAARRYLTHGDIEPPTPNQRARRLAEQMALEPGKLSKTALLQMYGDGPAAPWRYLSTGKYGLMAQEGIHPDELAELFGFDSGDALVRQLLEVPDPEAAIDARTDQMMLERYGDITSPAVLDHLADMAVHNEARLRFLNTELRALDQMMNARGDTGRVDARGRKISYNILEQAAREFAAQAIGRKKVRDAGKTGAYAAAETRAGKAAMDAMRKGDIQSAAEHKRAQVLNAHFFRAASKAGEEIDKIVRYLKKFDNDGTRKNLDRGYLDQIDQLLERVDLRKATQGEVERRRKLAEWVAEQEEKGFAPAIDQALIDEARLTHYTNLTMDELRALRDAVKSIEHLGRLKKKLLTAKDKREFDEVIEAAVASIEQNSRGVRPVEIETDLPQNRLRQGIGQFFASHRKIAEIFRQMDGDQDGGAMWSLLMQPLNEAMDREAVMKEEATIALNKLFLGLKRGGRLYQKEFIPEINASLTKMGRISVALNLGNDTNRARLNQGYGWTPQQIDAITRTLTKEDWDFVQGVWDLIDSYWPMIEAKELRVNGVAPEKVQAVPVVTPFGEYRGGYYPIRYDIEQSPKAHQDATAEAAKQAMRGARARATTRRGHLEQRVEEVRRPLSLSFSTIFEHLEQVIHDVAMHEFLIDQARVLNDKRMQDAIVRHYGAEIHRQLTNAMTAVAAGDVPATMAHERVANWLRTGASIAAMGWKLTTAMVQPLGLTQSMQRIGPKWVFKGIGRAFTDAAHLESSYAWIAEKSPMMRLRGKTLQREINEIRNRIEKEGWFQDQLNKVAQVVGAEQAPDVKNSYFWLIVKLQLVADVPTWIGQYEKSRAAGESEERAVLLADQAVLDSQGGGQIKDLAAVQRGHPWWKLWTNFYSFFNTTYNRTHTAVSRTRWKSPASVGRLAVDMLLLYALPAALSTLLYELWRNECDGDEECLVKKLAKDQITYAMGTVVGLREFAAMFQPYGYGGPAGARFIGEVSNLGRQIGQGEIDEALLRSANKAGGILFHYPAGQIDATARGVTALATGETERITAIGFGPPVNE